jgi:hypothetical protein
MDEANYHCLFSLRFWHPSRSFNDLESLLGISPRRNLKAGDARLTPSGTPLSGVHRQSFWIARLCERGPKTERLPRVLHALLDELEPKQTVFQELAGEGCRSELSIGWFLHKTNTGDVLDHRLMGRLANFCLDLSLDIYAPEPGEYDFPCVDLGERDQPPAEEREAF